MFFFSFIRCNLSKYYKFQQLWIASLKAKSLIFGALYFYIAPLEQSYVFF